MNNLIKEYAKVSGVKLWQVAEALGIQDSNFSKKLRHALSREEEQAICNVIDCIAAKKLEQKEGAKE